MVRVAMSDSVCWRRSQKFTSFIPHKRLLQGYLCSKCRLLEVIIYFPKEEFIIQGKMSLLLSTTGEVLGLCCDCRSCSILLLSSIKALNRAVTAFCLDTSSWKISSYTMLWLDISSVLKISRRTLHSSMCFWSQFCILHSEQSRSSCLYIFL